MKPRIAKIIITLFVAMLIVVPKSIRGEAGISEAARHQRFFINKPFALDRFEDCPKEDKLFVGIPVCDLITLVPDRIEFAEGIERVSKIKNYGTAGYSICFGETWDNKWYIGVNHPFISTQIFDKKEDWMAELFKHNVPASFTLFTFEQGYEKVNTGDLFQFSFWFFAYLIFFSIPWATYTYIKAGHHKLEIEEIKRKLNSKNESREV